MELETERLVLRKLTVADAPFMLALVNQPDWLAYIGDRGVHTNDDAVQYVRTRALELYEAGGGSGPCGVTVKGGDGSEWRVLTSNRARGWGFVVVVISIVTMLPPVSPFRRELDVGVRCCRVAVLLLRLWFCSATCGRVWRSLYLDPISPPGRVD